MPNTKSIVANFRTLDLGDVPHSRAGKNKQIVSMILRDLEQLKNGVALRVPLAESGKHQGKRPLRVEPRHSKRQTGRCHGHGRELPVRLERKQGRRRQVRLDAAIAHVAHTIFCLPLQDQRCSCLQQNRSGATTICL